MLAKSLQFFFYQTRITVDLVQLDERYEESVWKTIETWEGVIAVSLQYYKVKISFSAAPQKISNGKAMMLICFNIVVSCSSCSNYYWRLNYCYCTTNIRCTLDVHKMYFVFRSCFRLDWVLKWVCGFFLKHFQTVDQGEILHLDEVHWDQEHAGRQCRATFQVCQLSLALPCLAFLGANAFTQAPFHCLPMRKFEILLPYTEASAQAHPIASTELEKSFATSPPQQKHGTAAKGQDSISAAL